MKKQFATGCVRPNTQMYGYDQFISANDFINGNVPNTTDCVEQLKKPLFKAVIENRIFPDKLSHEYETKGSLNQGGAGVCYMTSTLNAIKYVVWKVAGYKFNFTQAEAYDFAADAKGLKGKNRNIQNINGGWPLSFASGTGAMHGIIRYNTPEWQAQHTFSPSSGTSTCIEMFYSICKDAGLDVTVESGDKCVVGPTFSGRKDIAMKVLHDYNVFVWAHDAYYLGGGNGLDSGHAILAIGYDQDYMYYKNSWSNDDSDKTYKHYGQITWSAMEKASAWASRNSIHTLNPKIFRCCM